MKIREQYETMQNLKAEINERLQGLDFHKITELLRWSAYSPEFQKLKGKENQLMMLDFFYAIWLREKKRLEKIGVHDDIFYGIGSLEDVESKYLTMQFGIYRLELNVPKTYQQEFVDAIMDKRISGIALNAVILRASKEQKENALKLARLLKANGQVVTAITLLQEAGDTWKKDEELLLELADCWLAGEQWRAAYDCLCQIETPKPEICDLMQELEGTLRENV